MVSGKTILKSAIPVALVGAVVFAAPILGQSNNAIPYGSTPDFSGSISYDKVELPHGFSLVGGRNIDNETVLSAGQNPAAWVNHDKTCKISPSVAYLSLDNAGRGDKFLSEQYVYENAEQAGVIPENVKPSFVHTDLGKLESLSASYEIKSDGSLSEDDEKTYYRTVNARAFDKSLPTGYGASSSGSSMDSGIPVIVYTYDCLTKDNYNLNEFNGLAKTIKANLTNKLSTDFPADAKPANEGEELDSKDDDVSDGYTFEVDDDKSSEMESVHSEVTDSRADSTDASSTEPREMVDPQESPAPVPPPANYQP